MPSPTFHQPTQPFDRVQIADLLEGKHKELSRVTTGSRGLMFARLASGAFAVIVFGANDAGVVDRIYNVTRIAARDLPDLEAAVIHARIEYRNCALGGGQ